MLETTPKTLAGEFVEQCRAHLQEQGISVREAAARMGAGRSYVYQVFAQQTSPTLNWCQRFAKATGMDLRITVLNIVAEAS